MRMPEKHTAFRFVLLMSIVSLFADTTYEGARSIAGPFLAQLGASGTVVGLVAGVGELFGYGLRSVAGMVADRTGKYWVAAFCGYGINLLSVPALALAGNWPLAAGLLVGERLGRGIRRPAASAMLSHAGSSLGQGWVFGFHEAMDQTGATIGPLSVALVVFLHGGLHRAFAVLLVPAVLSLAFLAVAYREYPSPRDLEAGPALVTRGFSAGYWTYVLAGAFLAAGFADFALISYHFSKAGVVPNALIPVTYAVAMLVGAAAAPLLGRLYDRYGIVVVVVAFALSAAFAPLVFLEKSFWLAEAGVLLWGLGMGAQDGLLVSVIARLAGPDKRATALGIFDTGFGIAWFAGSAVMGVLYDRSLLALVLLSVVLQLLALPLFVVASRKNMPQSISRQA